MVEYHRNPQAGNDGGTDSLRICVAGIGGAGSNVLDRITTDRTVEATLVSFQTDVRVLKRSGAPRKVQLGTDLMRGVGSGGDPDLGREAALFSKEDIYKSLEGHDMVFISAGLGGGTGSGASPVVAEIAKSTGAIVVVFATMPFSFEGRRRQQQSADALERLQKCADALILFDNNRMGELVLPKEGIQKAFEQGDQLIAQSVRAVSGIVSAPGLVKLGLDDLVTALRVSEGRCLFGFGESKGKDRGSEALKRALKSPLINQGELLGNAKNLLVHVVGGESLTLVEVEAIMKQLGRHVPDETQILFGIGVDPKLGDSVAVTLVSALSAQELATARRLPEPAEQQETPAAPARSSRQGTSAPKAAPATPPAPVAAPPVTEDAGDLFHSGSQPSAAVSAAALEAARASVPPPPPELIKPAPAPAPEPVAAKAPAPAPAPVAKAAPPPPPPAPEPEEEVYNIHDDDEVEAEAEPEPMPVVSAPPPPPPAATPRESARVRLMSFISGEKSAPHPEKVKAAPPPVDEVEIETAPALAPAAVVEPLPETVPVSIPRSVPQVRPAPQQERMVVSRTAPPPVTMSEPEPEPEAEPSGPDLFGAPEPAMATQVKKAPVGVEQQTLSLGQDKSGRFKDTEPSYATQGGDDLDVPTWMRLRRRAGR